MKKVISKKWHICNGFKGCGADIFTGFKCYPLRRKKYLCEKCGDKVIKNKKPRRTFMVWLCDWLRK